MEGQEIRLVSIILEDAMVIVRIFQNVLVVNFWITVFDKKAKKSILNCSCMECAKSHPKLHLRTLRYLCLLSLFRWRPRRHKEGRP